MSRNRVLVAGGALLALAVLLLVQNTASGPDRDQTPLGRLLDYRGPVERMVETETDVGGSSVLGQGRSRTVTTIAGDERSASVVTIRTCVDRKGQVSTDRSEKQYSVSGPTGREVVTVTMRAENYRSRTVNTFDGSCLIRELHNFTDRTTARSVTNRTCDARGRTLKEVRLAGGETTSWGTYRWLSSHLAFMMVWNSANGRQSATTNQGWMLSNRQTTLLLTSVVDIRTRYTYDKRGNWTRRQTKMTPLLPAGDNLSEREITYRDAGRPSP